MKTRKQDKFEIVPLDPPELELSEQQRDQLNEITAEIKNELQIRLLKYSSINLSIRNFSLVHANGEALDLGSCKIPGRDFFDEMGNWNLNASEIDENKTSPAYDEMCARINEILYPNILNGSENLSDKEKMILCALIYEIQTSIWKKYMPDMKNCFTEESIQAEKAVKEIIYRAIHDAVAHFIPNLKSYLSISASSENDNPPKKSMYKMTLGFLTSCGENDEKQLLVKSKEDNDALLDCKCVLF